MSFWRFFGFGQSTALTNRYGRQISAPNETIIDNTRVVGVDGALQIATVWRAVEILAKTIATLPIMVYYNTNGMREVARNVNLWSLLHERPNARQTPVEFWVAMLLNMLLRGNGYAEIKRNSRGLPIALIVMPADQVEMDLKEDGNDIYIYNNGIKLREIDAENVLHIKEMTGGYVGMSRLEYMRTSVSEHVNAQYASNGLFSKNGRTNGILSTTAPLGNSQWDDLRKRIRTLREDPQELDVIPADLKYQQVNLSPQDLQLLTTRQFTVQEIGRWFGIPAILLNQTEGTTTLGSSASDTIESFEKLTLRPMVINIEQSIRHRLMTPSERINLEVEFNLDGLLRASYRERMEIGSQAVQNGILSRNEVRQYENMSPYTGGDQFTVQSNLLPIEKLGQQTNTGGSVPTDPVRQ